MQRQLNRRLDRLERQRAERDGSRHPLTFAEMFNLPPGTTFLQVLQAAAELPAPPPPTARPPNQFDVDAYLAQLDAEAAAGCKTTEPPVE